MFEPKVIPTEKEELLLLPCHFTYDGVIERIRFLKHDEDWSKNIKRAVLNMIQVNLNEQTNVQGKQPTDEEMSNRIGDDFCKSRAFTISEVNFLSDSIYCLIYFNIR